MIKYQKWIDKNTYSLKDKQVLLIGGTGSIGRSTLEYLLYLNANIILAARNIDKANKIKEELLAIYPYANIAIEYLDISDLDSIDLFQLSIDKKYPKIDIFINNSGIYSLPKGISKQGYEIHFATNALGNYYLLKKILFDLKDDAKIINTSSISYNFNKLNFNDFEGIYYKSSIKRYGLTKRIMTFNTLKLKDDLKSLNYKINLVHPGICATELFTKNNQLIYKIFYPFMKLIFHNSYKASLSIIKGIFEESQFNEWLGPKYFNIWGMPKKAKLNKQVCNLDVINKVNDVTKNLIERQGVGL